jgi:hypothetical protein
MNNKKLHFHALALAVMLAASSAAMATVIPVTLTNTIGNLWTAHIGNTPGTSPFSDTFTFSPPATPGSSAWTLLTNLSFSGNGSGNILFTSASLNGNPLFVNSLIGGGNSFSMALLTSTLVSGPLTLTVNGTSTGGSYGGAFAVQMAPVPEPETYAMLIGGLGILAALARRRKQ